MGLAADTAGSDLNISARGFWFSRSDPELGPLYGTNVIGGILPPATLQGEHDDND
jgi:hypothetical protein